MSGQIRSQFKNSDESLKEAEAKFRQGKFAEAEPLFLLALVLLERTLPEDHPDVMSCMEKLGDTFYASQKFKDAAPVYRRLVGIREKSLGANPLTLSALFKMAKVHERLGQVDEAEEHYKRGVALGEKVPGPLYANLCDAYSSLLKRSGRHAEEALRLETLAKRRREVDGTAAARVGEGTLKMAAIQIPAAESLEADEEGEEDEEYEEEESDQGEEENVEEYGGESQEQPAAAPDDGPSFDPADLDAIKAPGAEATKPVTPAPAKPDILSRTPKPTTVPGSFLKRKTEETGSPSTVQVPGNQFTKEQLDSSTAPTPGGQPFSLDHLEAIKPGAAAAPFASTTPGSGLDANGQPYSTDALHSIKTPGVGKPPALLGSDATAHATRADVGASGALGSALDKSVLDSIKAPALGIKPAAGIGDKALIKPPLSAKQLEAIQTPEVSAVDDKAGLQGNQADPRKAPPLGVGRSDATVPGGLALSPALIPAMVALVLIVCVVVVTFGLMNHQAPSNEGISPYFGKTFRTADRKQQLKFDRTGKAEFSAKADGGKPQIYQVSLRSYSGSPLDEVQAVAGIYDKGIWLQDHLLGLKTEGGAILYAPDAPELSVIDEMWHLADAAALFYTAHGRYPRQGQKDQMRLLYPKLKFVNALTKQDTEPELLQLKWPADDTPNLISTQTSLEKKWLEGEPFSDGQSIPGTIRCAQIGTPPIDDKLVEDFHIYGTQRIDEFFIEGYNRYSELLQGADNKVFIITLKNGNNMTSISAPPIVPAGVKSPVEMVVSNSEHPNKVSIILKYLLLISFFAVVIGVWIKWPEIHAKLRREEPPKGIS